MKPISAILSLFICIGLYGQSTPAFIPLDDKHFKPVEAFISGTGDKLYYASIEKHMGFAQAALIISTWNGQFHTSYPAFEPESFFYGSINRSALCLHKDSLYAGASFSSTGNKDAGVVKWNGSTWERVGSGIWSDYAIFPELSVKKLLSYGNELLACGNFNQIAAGPCQGFVSYDGSDWKNIPLNGRVNDMLVTGDTLIAAGSVININGVACNQIAMKVNGNWIAMGNPGMEEILQIAKFGHGLVALSKTQVKIFSNGLWTDLSGGWNYEISYTGSAAEYGQSLYISGVFKDISGLTSHLLQWDGSTWKSIVKAADISPAGGTRFYIRNIQNHLYFGGNLKSFFGTKVLHVVELFPGHSIVKGYLYKDNNQNCLNDAGDEIIPNAIISLDEGQYFSSTDANGFYQLALSPAVGHSLRVFPAPNQKVGCGPELFQITTGVRDTVINKDFAFTDQPLPPGEFIRIDCTKGFKVKHGYDAHYSISFSADEQHYPFDLVLNYPQGLSGFQTENNPTDIKDKQIIWRIEGPGQIKFSFNINPLHFNMGDQVMYTAHAQKAQWIIENSLRQTVVSAFDPNDKQCSDSRISTGTRTLDYRINFQNLGTAEAGNVYVVDTINRNMPLQYLKVLDYSHKSNYSVNFKVRDHAVIWGFDDINLGAKNVVGDELSSGFVSFVSGLESHLKIGDSITNRAAIYFDFQPPVFTNTAVTEVVTYAQAGNQLGLQLYLYPNPNSGRFTLSLEPYNIRKAEIYDVNGRLIYSKNGENSGQLEIDAGLLADGLYVVKVYHALGVISKQFTLIN